MWKLTLTEAMKCEFAAVQPPCPKHRLAELESRAEETLGLVPPGEYLELLKVTDGFMLNGVQIYASRTAPLSKDPKVMMPGLVETNQDYSFLESEFLAIGEWDLDLFVVHQQSGEFRSISKTDADTVTVFASCGEMLEFAIKKGMD